MSSTPEAADARLLEAHDLALGALSEITPASTVGPAAGYTVEEGGAVSLRFANTMPGYPDWFWTVTVAVVDDSLPTVLEIELLPGEGALLAPDWVPWAVRLADYQAVQAVLAAERGEEATDAADASDEDDDDDDLDDELDELDDLDAADFDQDGSPILHSGDVDGVDIDVLDPSATDDDEDEESDGDEDDESEDDEDDDSY